jgi:hypothetical protein
MRYFIPLLLTTFTRVALAQGAPAAILVQQYAYAPVGIAPGTTLRLNVANLSGGTTVCMGNLAFMNSDGTTIKNQDITVKAGQIFSYPLLISDIQGSPSSAEVRGFVKIDRPVGGTVGMPPSAPCTSTTSLEVVDVATGQTRAILTNPTPISGIPLPTSIFTVGPAQPQ